MFKNHIQVALRNFKKRKGLSLINIIGLGISICAFLLIYEFVSFEKSFDNFHQKADRIYRVQYEKVSADFHDKSVGLAAGGGPELKKEFPEIEEFSKIWATTHLVNLLTVESESYISEKLFYADNNFFNLFDFEFLQGDRVTALESANALVITETMAKRIFGKTEVLGKLVNLKNGMGDEVAKITGVIKDLPANTHFDFEVLVSFKTLVNQSRGSAASTFGWNAFPTYLLLKEDIDITQLEAKFPGFIENHYQEEIADGIQPIYKLMPLKDIYLHSNIRFEVGSTGSVQVVQILSAISVFILILAYFNYINITTTLALERAKEVGVRKVTGATRRQLFSQFMTESLLFNLISILFGFTLMQLSKPYFAELMSVNYITGQIINLSVFPILFFILTFGVLISGFYPAWILSRIDITNVLQGKSKSFGKTNFFTKGLVVFQFSILCFLLVGSFAVRSQIKFMLNADWGFDADKVVVLKGPVSGGDDFQQFDTFLNQLASFPEVISVTQSTVIPGKEIAWINNDVRRAGTPSTENTPIHFVGINDTYINTLDLEMIAGRNFSREIATDTAHLLLSRSATKALGFLSPEGAVNQKITMGGEEYLVVGIVEDYMQESFRKSLNPIAYEYDPWVNNYFSTKITSDNYKEVLEKLESTYNEYFPGNPFEYFFLDDFFQKQFKEDQTFGRVFNLFTALGILISCLGLIGLASQTVTQRRKEMGIRKVLGANLWSILLLISIKMLWLSIVAILFSIPLAYLSAQSWLQNYTFATDLHMHVFTLPICIVLIITLFTTGILSFYAGLKNPIDSLHCE